jgi:hypothetical protein
MKGKYFTVKIKPDIVDGDISKLIENDKTDTPFTSADILFDWQAIDVPKGTVNLESISVYMVGEDGATQVNKDFYFVFAKSVNGTAPTTLGEENAAQTACFELPLHFIGAAKMEASSGGAGNLIGPAFGSVYITKVGGANGVGLPMVMTPEPISGTNVGYDKIYVAAFAGGAFDFSTGVESTGAISADAQTTIAVDQVDARKCFQKDDIVYVHDVDTACGTVSSVASGVITLTGNNVVAIANNDEIINATPITCIFGFSQ